MTDRRDPGAGPPSDGERTEEGTTSADQGKAVEQEDAKAKAQAKTAKLSPAELARALNELRAAASGPASPAAAASPAATASSAVTASSSASPEATASSSALSADATSSSALPGVVARPDVVAPPLYSFAEMWPEADRPLVARAQASVLAGDARAAIRDCQELMDRLFAGILGPTATQPHVAALLCGLDGPAWLRMRIVAAEARADRPVTVGEATDAFCMAIEALVHVSAQRGTRPPA